MALKYRVVEEGQEELESLIGWGTYLAESEALTDYLRELQARYGPPGDMKELRRKLDRALDSRELSAVLRQMRDEEMH